MAAPSANPAGSAEPPSQLSLVHGSDRVSLRSGSSSRGASHSRRSEIAGPSSDRRATFPDELEDADSDATSEFDAFMRQGRIQVGQTWDDSSDDETQPSELGNRTLPLSSHMQQGRGVGPKSKRKAKRTAPESYLESMRPTREHRRAWWKFLTNPGTPASLSAPHVSANLFSASLHPAVLLSMPNYFARTGVLPGTVALVGVAALGGVGGGLWVVLSRYVNASSIEAIVGSSFGRYTRWKGGLGRAVSGLLLALYATGSAVIGYFALADLLLQVFFHYSPRGVPLHDRAFVTLVIGGLISIPLVIFPLAKRNVIRLNTFFSLSFYPLISLIILIHIYTAPPKVAATSTDLLHLGKGLKGKWPNFNPLKPPSIWAPISLLPLLTLSACPLQILAHQRSLRRIGTSRSNVKAFVGAQAGQVVFIVVLGLVFGVAAGTKGVQARLGKDVHPNLFASLPTDDDAINFARVLFVAILATHLAICLMTARSSWGRLLRLLDMNPLRRRKPAIQLPADEAPESTAGRMTKWKRQWGKPARNALAGLLLWGITASSAYLSGAGGFRRAEKEGEEARFTRASEVLGLMGAGVGFVLPGLVWLVIFHVRRPRAILPPFASELGKTATAYFVGPQSLLARNRKYLFGTTSSDQEQAPLLAEQNNDTEEQIPHRRPHSRRSLSSQIDEDQVPSHLTEQTSEDRDQATSILLARKERQLQRKTRGKRIYQDVIVIAAVLPFGIALLILGAIELRRGGF